jgi:hypothetical protein
MEGAVCGTPSALAALGMSAEKEVIDQKPEEA